MNKTTKMITIILLTIIVGGISTAVLLNSKAEAITALRTDKLLTEATPEYEIIIPDRRIICTLNRDIEETEHCILNIIILYDKNYIEEYVLLDESMTDTEIVTAINTHVENVISHLPKKIEVITYVERTLTNQLNNERE